MQKVLRAAATVIFVILVLIVLALAAIVVIDGLRANPASAVETPVPAAAQIAYDDIPLGHLRSA